VGFAIYSFRLGFSDLCSPQFGTDALTQKNAFKPEDGNLVQIKVKATGLRIASIIFKA
jgi:hypothetical protein